MGIFWNTYLCSGKFIDTKTATIHKRICLATLDQIIEEREWITGLVDKNELMKYLSLHDEFKDIKFIKQEDLQIENPDLFLAEVCVSSLDNFNNNTYKYILIERNCDYEL
jgi:hypothetical protein